MTALGAQTPEGNKGTACDALTPARAGGSPNHKSNPQLEQNRFHPRGGGGT